MKFKDKKHFNIKTVEIPFIVVIFILIGYSCKRHKPCVQVIQSEQPTKLIANIYIDNSSSMNGYLCGNSEFKDVLGTLLVKFKTKYGNPNLYYINSQIYKAGINNNVDGFLQTLSPKTMNIGDTGSSNINSIFSQILNHTNNDTVSILFSDGIYSIQGTNSQNLLNLQKNLTMNAFSEIIKKQKDFATIILQCKSYFNDFYYDMDDKPIPYKGERPYYIFIMGKYNLIDNINKMIDLSNDENGLNGLQNKYMLSSKFIEFNDTNSSAITSYYTNASKIEPLRHGVGFDLIKKNRHSNDNLQFAVAIDANDLFTDNNYLKDISNYEISPIGFKVVKVEKITDTNPAYGDCTNLKNPYAIVLKSDGTLSPQVTINLQQRIPKWVAMSSTDNDVGKIPSSYVTFGISYLIQGIADAFDYSKSVFEEKIQINKIK